MKIEEWPIDRPVPYFQNPRDNAKALPKVVASLREFGFRQPIVVDAAGVVVAGHTRLAAARELGLATVPVHVADELTPEQAKAYRIMDNRSGEEATWEHGLLRLELEGLHAAGGNTALELAGFDASELRSLKAKRRRSDEGDEDNVPSGLARRSEPGDLWILGPHRLLVGDATQPADVARLMGGHLADAIVTDPPYAIYGSSSGVSADVSDDKMVRPFFEALFRLVETNLREFGHGYICCDWRSWSSLWETAKRTRITAQNMFVWYKGDSGLGNHYSNCHELAFFCTHLPPQRTMTSSRKRGQRGVLRPNVQKFERTRGKERLHNASKPVALFEEWITNSAGKDAVVLDPFLGSGTTIIAADKVGARCFALEIDPKNADVAVARWERFTNGTATKITAAEDATAAAALAVEEAAAAPAPPSRARRRRT